MSILSNFDKIHFIGAGGVSISALAKYVILKGKAVSGSDRYYSTVVDKLSTIGCDVWLGEDISKVDKKALVVYSSAIQKNHKELKEALRIGMPTLERLDFLAEVESDFKSKVAVAGTHGKTTVTAMLASIFQQENMQYTAHIGGIPIDGDNLIYNGDEVFLTEACEYKKSFLKLSPNYAIVNNLEFDHPDTYKDFNQLLDAFTSFITKPTLQYVVMPYALKYAHIDIWNYAHIITFGNNGDCQLSSIFETNCGYDFSIQYKDAKPFRVQLNICGMHNVYNALAAATLSLAMGLSVKSIQNGLSNFKGVERRFEKKGLLNNAPVYIDYAHHPSEIKATIDMAKSKTKGRLFVVFQPHTYSRTKSLFKEFLQCFSKADVLFLTASYSARECKEQGLASIDLYRELKASKMFCTYHEKLLPIAENLVKNVKKDDFILILGAGDIDNLAKMIVD